MHPLAFSTVWLLGAASAGDKGARSILATLPQGMIREISPALMEMVRGVTENNASSIKEGFGALTGGVELKPGERCLDAILRSMHNSEVEWAVRVVASATKLESRQALAKRFAELAEDLKKRS